MNIVPIVTIPDLSADSFDIAGPNIDLKLSKDPGNGLTLKEDGLAYTSTAASGSVGPRILLASFNSAASMLYSYNGEVDIILTLQDLGSDGKYANFKLNCLHNASFKNYSHSDDGNINDRVGSVQYGFSFDGAFPDSQSSSQLSYESEGVTTTLTFSAVWTNEGVFIWVDVSTPNEIVMTPNVNVLPSPEFE